MFKNMLMFSKPSKNHGVLDDDAEFLTRGAHNKIWKDLIKNGLSVQAKWKSDVIRIEGIDSEVIHMLGDCLFEVLRSPSLTVPALIKEDNNVDFHSVYSQYLYAYLFRMKNINFTFLSDLEVKIRDAFSLAVKNATVMSEEIATNSEEQIFLNLRWYSANPL